MKLSLTNLVAFCAISVGSIAWADPVGPSPSHTNIISIPHIFANPSGVFDAYVQQNSATAITATYTLTSWDGKAWTTVKTGSLTIKPKATADIRTNFALTKTSQTLRLEVRSTNPTALASRDIKVAGKKTFIIKYKTNGWVQIAYEFQKTTTQLIGQAVQKPAAEARDLGFKTRTRRSHTTVVFGTDSYRTYADARLDNWVEMTFDSAEARDKFKRSIYKLVPSFTDEGTGLQTKESEK